MLPVPVGEADHTTVASGVTQPRASHKGSLRCCGSRARLRTRLAAGNSTRMENVTLVQFSGACAENT